MSKKKSKEKYKSIPIQMPIKIINKIDDLVKKGKFLNRSDFIRYAIRRYLSKNENEKK
jgi:Arc/MetJ-type ribon-helix-helix transcriptional regulator